MEIAMNEAPAIRIGSSWYPEMWPEDQWAVDIGRMKNLGFNIVRMFEFAWHRLEPEEGRFDFGWARRILDLCYEAGIQVIVGTPTAAPPAWLSAKYPEILRMDSDNRRASHGQRKHYSVYSARYRIDCARIVGAIAEGLGNHPAIVGWQIDNEMGGLDFSDEAATGFRDWLKRRFENVAALNRLWGLEFWSQAYADFEQIPLPPVSFGGAEIGERHHPSLIMAAARYNNDAWSSFIALQCEIIRRHSSRPISTNMTPGLQMDWFAHNRPLDRVGLSTYRDLDHYAWTLAFFDRMRAEKAAPFWILETSPSWSAAGRIWNIHHSGDGVRAFSWLTLLCGADTLLYWQWRQHWAGQEMLHGVLVNSTGRWSATARDIGAFAHDAHEQAAWLAAHPPAAADLAIMLSPQAAWAFSIDPTDDDMSYETRWREDYYLPLANSHIWREVIGPDGDLSRYRVLLLPLLPIVPPDLRSRILAWVNAGGVLVLGPLSGNRSEDMTAFTDRELGGLEEIIGAQCALEFTVKWVEKSVWLQSSDGRKSSLRGSCAGFEPTTAETLARYAGGYGDGMAGIVQNRFGKGYVITIGGQIQPSMYLELVNSAMRIAGIRPLAEGGEGVAVIPRVDAAGAIAAFGVVNLTEQEQAIELPCPTIDRLGGGSLPRKFVLAPLQVVIAEVQGGKLETGN
jgi:beta-galactosidase GanA